jgi:calcineurin-like phosphoesterase family protein
MFVTLSFRDRRAGAASFFRRHGVSRLADYRGDSLMHITRKALAVVAAGFTAGTIAFAQNGTPINPHSKNALTLAVYGDSPYGTTNTDTSETEKTPAFIATINADPKVDLVLHVGDIHSGKQFCTDAYDRQIFDLWNAFKNPLIYTPGDNEWTDCHKAAEGGADPLANLSLVRSIFFANPGYALGGRNKRVLTQAVNYDPGHPADAEYVENVMWEQSQVLFVTVNVPGGSNNDDDKWFGAAETPAQAAAQTAEVARRTAADLRWLDAAFVQAQQDGVEAVLIQLQADMWDRDGKAAAHLSNYKVFLDSISARTMAFGKPVLLLNGDSHHYRSDNPLAAHQACVFENGTDAGTVDCNSIPDPGDGTYTQDAWANQPYYNVPNFHRIIVHGSTFPMEWIRLTITPGTNAAPSSSAFGPFSWARVIAVQ